jgi:hypothetical protein
MNGWKIAAAITAAAMAALIISNWSELRRYRRLRAM